MSTDLVSLNYSSATTASSLVSTTSSSSSSASAASSLNTGSLGIQGDGDGKSFSKGAEMMQKLSDLQSSDPEKFKEVARNISDKLTEAAKNSTDSKAASLYTTMAEKFASAAQSGDMSSLTPPEAPAAAGAQGQAAMKYAQASGTNPMETLDSVISGALSGVDSASA